MFAGYANKGHDGFVGHSYVGRWVNLGAGTITSNFKNTYGNVALWTPAGVRDTGMQFLGTLFGDHVKTGIGLRLTTGTVLGAGANVYGEMPPKVVAPFSWGDAPPYASYRADKFLETAARMMSRRHVELTERAGRHLAAIHAGRWTVDDGSTRRMKIWMLGSGSNGNAILVECDGSRLLVDCGFGTRTLAARLQDDRRRSRIDRRLPAHARARRSPEGAAAAALRWGWGIYATPGTATRARAAENAGPHVRARHDARFSAHDDRGDARLSHDANESVGFVVTSRSTGARAGLFYDIGCVTRARREGL